MEQPIMTFMKKADKEKNRIIIPKAFVKSNGNQFYMLVYSDRIELKPIVKKKGE